MITKKTKDRVEHLLKTSPELRDDDYRLTANIWFEDLKKLGLATKTSSGYVGDSVAFLHLYSKGKFTNPESIRRCRAKLQQIDKSLRGVKRDKRIANSEKVKEELRSESLWEIRK